MGKCRAVLNGQSFGTVDLTFPLPSEGWNLAVGGKAPSIRLQEEALLKQRISIFLVNWDSWINSVIHNTVITRSGWNVFYLWSYNSSHKVVAKVWRYNLINYKTKLDPAGQSKLLSVGRYTVAQVKSYTLFSALLLIGVIFYSTWMKYLLWPWHFHVHISSRVFHIQNLLILYVESRFKAEVWAKTIVGLFVTVKIS